MAKNNQPLSNIIVPQYYHFTTIFDYVIENYNNAENTKDITIFLIIQKIPINQLGFLILVFFPSIKKFYQVFLAS